jgi:hypothetical protein
MFLGVTRFPGADNMAPPSSGPRAPHSSGAADMWATALLSLPRDVGLAGMWARRTRTILSREIARSWKFRRGCWGGRCNRLPRVARAPADVFHHRDYKWRPLYRILHPPPSIAASPHRRSPLWSAGLKDPHGCRHTAPFGALSCPGSIAAPRGRRRPAIELF